MNGNCYYSEGINPTVTCNKNEGNRVAIPVLTPDRAVKHQNGRRIKEDGDPSYTVTAQEPQGVAIGFNTHDDGTSRTIKSQYQRNSAANFTRHDGLGASCACVKVKSALKCGYEIAGGEESAINLSYPNSETRRGRVGTGVANTLDTKCEQGVVDTIYYPNGDCQIAIRKLTPKECFRLQAFPDEMFERAKFVNSDSQLYKQAGNSVTVNVVYQIARKLKEANDKVHIQ